MMQVEAVPAPSHLSRRLERVEIQRVVRQIKSAGLTDDIVIATGLNQNDSIENQLGDSISVVTEPCRCDTFPAIMLACAFPATHGTAQDESVIIMPYDSYTESGYFTAITKMAEAVKGRVADIVLIGIEPTYPSARVYYTYQNRSIRCYAGQTIHREAGCSDC